MLYGGTGKVWYGMVGGGVLPSIGCFHPTPGSRIRRQSFSAFSKFQGLSRTDLTKYGGLGRFAFHLKSHISPPSRPAA